MHKFIQDYVSHLGSPIVLSMFKRMIETNNYVKSGIEVYKLTDEEKQKIQDKKDELFELAERANEVKNYFKPTFGRR